MPGATAVDTLGDAAAAFRTQQHSQVSEPRPVTLGGYDGLYVELRIPEKFDFAACPSSTHGTSTPTGACPTSRPQGWNDCGSWTSTATSSSSVEATGDLRWRWSNPSSSFPAPTEPRPVRPGPRVPGRP